MPTRSIGLSGEKYLRLCCIWFLQPRPTRFPKSKVSRFFAFHFQPVENCIFYKLPNRRPAQHRDAKCKDGKCDIKLDKDFKLIMTCDKA